MLRTLVLLSGLLFMSLPLSAAEDPAPIETFRIWLDLEIDETGQVTSAKPVSKIDDALHDVVVEATRQWIFAPMADRNGVPAPSTSSTWLELSLVEGPAGVLDLQINRLYEGPRPTSMPQPVLRGDVTKISVVLPVQFVVEKNGKTRDITLLESGPQQAYNQAAKEAIRTTRFIPRTAAGDAIAVWAVFPVEFQGPGLDAVLTD